MNLLPFANLPAHQPRTFVPPVIDLGDWVQMGRYVSFLDPLSPEEFVRADCSPRELRGNGILTVADWVQIARGACSSMDASV